MKTQGLPESLNDLPESLHDLPKSLHELGTWLHSNSGDLHWMRRNQVSHLLLPYSYLVFTPFLRATKKLMEIATTSSRSGGKTYIKSLIPRTRIKDLCLTCYLLTKNICCWKKFLKIFFASLFSVHSIRLWRHEPIYLMMIRFESLIDLSVHVVIKLLYWTSEIYPIIWLKSNPKTLTNLVPFPSLWKCLQSLVLHIQLNGQLNWYKSKLTFLVPIPDGKKNLVKFSFLHFFVVPQKVLWSPLRPS